MNIQVEPLGRAQFGAGLGASTPPPWATPPMAPRVPQPASLLNPCTFWIFVEASFLEA